MYKVLKNKRNLYTLLRYRKEADNEMDKKVMSYLIDYFSRDFNIFNRLKLIPNSFFFECLLLDLEME